METNGPDSIIPYLPPLTEDRRIPELDAAARWEADDVAVYLQRLAMSMRVDSEASTRFSELVSVPDVWAHPLVFTAAWLDDNHVLHEEIRSEWRGLLALLGLSEHNQIAIDFSVIDLSDLSREPWKGATRVTPVDEASGNGVRAPNLMAILHRYMPRLVLTPNQSWNNFEIIRFGARPIGLVIPPILVCPARDYGAVLPEWIYWRCPETGRLADPTRGDRLSIGECNALAHYLDHIITEIQQYFKLGDRDEARLRLRGNLEDALKHYRQDVASVAQRLGQRRAHSTFTTKRNDRQPRLYPFLFDYPIIESGRRQPAVASDTLWKVRPDIDTNVKGAIIVDSEIATQNRLNARSVRIWGEYFLKQVEEIPGVFETIRTLAACEGYAVLRTGDLFTETILHIKGGEVKSHLGLASQYLLPLKPVTLLFATRDQLRENVKLASDDESITVTLDLVVANEEGVERRYRAAETYSRFSQIHEIEPPALLATWPDFQCPHWKNHLLFCASRSGNLVPVQPFSASVAKEALECCDDPVARVNQGFDESFYAPTSNRGSATFPKEQGYEVSLCWMDHAPEALFCGANDPQAQGQLSAGLLLLEALANVEPQEGHWKVGIDFGPINTTAYWAKDEGIRTQPSVARFGGRVKTAFKNHAEPARSILQEEFLPREEVQSPFLSMLQERGHPPSLPRKPLFSHCIHYVGDSVGSTLTPLGSRRAYQRLHFDLRWSRDADNLKRVEDYLAQVGLQTLAELAFNGASFEQIDWYFSYPASFTDLRREQIESVYIRAVEQIGGSESRGVEQRKALQVRQQSEAEALYFIKQQQVNFSSSVITMDVGGQTSDICIWNRRRLRWRNSQHLAGQHILIQYLAHHTGFLDRFPFAEQELQEIKTVIQRLQSEPSKLHQALEIMVNGEAFRRTVDENLPRLRDKEEVRALLLLAEFSLAGLLYYLAKVCAYLDRMGHISATGRLRICFGGRGSLIFRHIAGKNNIASFKRLFLEASGLNWHVEAFNFSDAPKHEVAFGLVVDPAGAAELDWSNPVPRGIIGEELTVGGQTVAPEDALRSKHLDQDWTFTKIPEFERFVDIYQRAFGRIVPLKRHKGEIISRVYNEIQDFKHILKISGGDSALELVNAAEPLLIVVLREFITLMNEHREVILPSLLKLPGGMMLPSFNSFRDLLHKSED